jgi:hypothetical protein
MRKRLIRAAAIGAVLAGVVGASALAATTTLRAGTLKITVSATPSPKTLPRNELAPFALKAGAKIQTTDGTHPPAFREAILGDKNVAINAEGVPVCRGGQLEARDTKAAKSICGKAIVGHGRAHAEIAFPEQTPIEVPSPLLVFNGGTKHGKTTLYIHAYITVPVSAAIVTTITVEKVRNGLHAVAKVPVIAGGSGSALDFQLTIGKDAYLEAKCPDGHFPARIEKAVFKNDANIEGVAPETVLSGNFAVPCTPIG